MNDSIQPLLTLLAHKFTWFPTALMFIGAMRVAFKWFNGPIQKKLTDKMVAAANSPDAEEERDWETVLKKRWYRISTFALDLLFSVKLPVLADFLRAKAGGPNTPQTQQSSTTNP